MTKQHPLPIIADNTVTLRAITRNPAWRPLMMKRLDDQEAMDKVAAIVLLQQRIYACRLCQEHGYILEAHPLTSGRGSDRLMVIGQAPGHRSITKGRPWSGPGGRILQKWLEQAGFPPGYLHEHAYLNSLTRCDPGRNPRGDGDRRPSPPEVALCRPFLEEEVQLLQPKVILLVGSMAIETYLGRGRLEDIIGTFQERDGMRLLPLPHPSGVSRWLNDPEHLALLQRALQLLSTWRVEYGL